MSREVVRDVASATDPVGAVLDAYAAGDLLSLRTSGTTSRPRAVVRTAASWVDSFPAVTALTGMDASSRMWVPGPLSSTMNLFAAAHARSLGAAVLATPEGATHASLTPALLARCLDERSDLRGVHVVVAGDALSPALSQRAVAAGARVSSYYGAAELSFIAWGSHQEDLRAFPGVEIAIRGGCIWVRSPYISRGYAGADGPFSVAADGFATVGDSGSLTDGVLQVAGRGDAAVITGGVTVLVADVERVLRRPATGEVLVLALPHARLGAVVGAVLTDPADLPRVREAARAGLDPAHRPRRWFAVPALPLTAAGKVDRAALAELVAADPSTRLASVPRASDTRA